MAACADNGICVHNGKCVCTCVHTMLCRWKSEDNLQESILLSTILKSELKSLDFGALLPEPTHWPQACCSSLPSDRPLLVQL